ncbi:MAG: DUF1361 domain-containing protein [Treponema sp.]|nr:DUF1361 domain-containing protein [Candidatus Treponema merdequi]
MNHIKTYFKNIFSIRSTKLLCAISVFAVVMALMRFFVTGYTIYLFMLTNLFLAFVPWFISSIIQTHEIKNRFLFAVLIFFWIIFFPNAPYMLTDLIHLGKNRAAPLWYDLIMLLTFGFAGLYYAFVSLEVIEEKLKKRMSGKNKIVTNKFCIFNNDCRIFIFRVIFIYITCFGIYLGRFLRWNTWDLLGNFGGVMNDVCKRVLLPFNYPGAWGFSVLGGTFLNLIYMIMKNGADSEVIPVAK